MQYRQSTIDSVESTEEYLSSIIGLPLHYVLKSPDTELYDFGFGKPREIDNWYGKIRKLCPYTLHVLCDFSVLDSRERIEEIEFDGNSTPEKEEPVMKGLVGKKVQAVKVIQNHDLIIDFKFKRLWFITNSDSEESWRFFATDLKQPHIVASAHELWVEW